MFHVRISRIVYEKPRVMRLLNNFISYVKIDSTADENSVVRPSSTGQFVLAELLKSQLKEIGLTNIIMGQNGTVYAKLAPSNGNEDKPTLGFIAHMDTSGAFSGKVNPQIHNNYDGGAITFKNGDCIDPKKFNTLKEFVGQTLITTDGTSLLGADDKAGIAEIIELLYRIKENNIPHPGISVAFTTDEEIGLGATGFDVEVFDAKYAYTVDGGIVGSVDYETFNAATATLEITGVSVHTGAAKGLLVNATTIATEFINRLPKTDCPELTEGYEGFIHVDSINSNVSKANVIMLVRDHDNKKFEEKKQLLIDLTETINQIYNNVAVIKIKDSYRNMADVIRTEYHLIENAVKAINNTGVKEIITPIRGGTDGAKLSFMGIPCPNLSTGGAACHGPYEHISLEAMEKVVDILCEITKLYAESK